MLLVAYSAYFTGARGQFGREQSTETPLQMAISVAVTIQYQLAEIAESRAVAYAPVSVTCPLTGGMKFERAGARDSVNDDRQCCGVAS